MSFKIVIFAAAVFACQVNAQMSLIRPFASGFTNGISEMAKPFVQFGQSLVSPASEYLSGRKPSVSQWLVYPSQIYPQAQAGLYEGFDAISSVVPGGSYIQTVPNVIKPPTQSYQIPKPSGASNAPRPYPIPSPSSIAEEAANIYGSSNLQIKPNPTEVKLPKAEGAMTLEGKFEMPSIPTPSLSFDEDEDRE